MRRSTPLFVLAILTMAACGSSSDGSADAAAVAAETTVPAAASSEPAPNPDKPPVEIPAELPTELTTTELRPGEGPEAADGDQLLVDYVGVRSEDGTEFDNSWDRGSPFPVTLGAGGVIPGWDQGLVGSQAGGRYQLDIPAELAYGDAGAGDTIKPGDALSFVIDVRVVVKPSISDDEPQVTVPTSTGATEVTTEDLVDGTGDEAVAGDHVFVDLLAYRGDTGEQVDSTWGVGGPFELILDAEGGLPGLVQGIEGMKVGGRRQIIIPADDAFGAQGNPDIGIPADTDLIVIVDLAARYA